MDLKSAVQILQHLRFAQECNAYVPLNLSKRYKALREEAMAVVLAELPDVRADGIKDRGIGELGEKE